ncbi:ileal sodium/bile acid cotransporter-like [Uloborus diversus]|uniref:ileal sodium/bile acid cotransporter-like n=1 Tax=Uloborus diversus TaxID=327109 RepID=UPI00240A5CAA|nr:ileal sodium/bile acid cotransporter-like [Uloborus diversus]
MEELSTEISAYLNSSGNGTAGPPPVPLLKTVHDILLVVLLVAVMFAMGCHITWEQLWIHIRRPVGIVIGMCSQFVLLPLSAFCLIKILNLGILHATGLLLLACSPGGVTSNIFTYFCDGDISLSIAMTTCSTLVALGMMPLNLYMYGQNLNQDDVVIPYGKMALSLVSVTCPVLVGMLVHWKFPKLAAALTKIGSYAGLLIIVICQTMEFFIFPNIFANVPWQLYFSVVILPFLGFSLGYTSAWLCRQKPQVRRTISIESGVQNVGTALTVASLSFPFHNLEKVLLFPWLYAFSMTGVCVIISAFYQLYVRQCSLSKSVETLPADCNVSAVRYAEEGGKANGAYIGDSTKM